ncbi:hypothetical protein RISK_002939 [Rhodopirellula islandica]|uniref:Uncharacterized protein n=1 Tax=Rhodopirellula islandica TaxID=595434 RepID=A0A0J1BF21_RHOIS|nr:hypothetical protein RISK_002939 [Rhodopirellula islandica]
MHSRPTKRLIGKSRRIKITPPLPLFNLFDSDGLIAARHDL